MAAEHALFSENISEMAHELRTPLSAILGISEIALQDTANVEHVEDSLCKIKSSASYLLSIVNDILDMSRLQCKTIKLHSERFCFDELLSPVESIASSQAALRNISYTTDSALPGGRYFVGDYVKLQHILINLLNNALKYTPEGGSVCLRIREVEPEKPQTVICFCVSDTGIGIDQEFLPRVFEPFSRERDGETAPEGTGLGLAICRELVTLLNGEIRVDSVRGKGTSFTVRLPLEKPGAVQDSGEEKYVSPAKEKLEMDFTGMRVLLAEDHPLNVEILRHILQKKGIASDTAENGCIAVKRFADSPDGYYDAIFMDIRMPVLNGKLAASRIRLLERKDSRTVPIIALTADTESQERAVLEKFGFTDCLAKPLHADALYRHLYRLTRQHTIQSK